MENALGRLTARLEQPDAPIPANFVDLINTNINPPNPVTAADVIVRAMYIVSDEVNSFGGRFPADEQSRLCPLLVDSPVMIGHRKDRLPIARNFHAEITRRDGRRWLKCWFYWLKGAPRAAELRDNIDGGIYKECSISFTFHFPECSVCGQDIRLCRHQPFEKYTVKGTEEICHFVYRRIERVLETSLVYRGAVPDTAIVKHGLTLPEEITVDSLDELPEAEKYLVVPCYEGMPVRISAAESATRLVRPDGTALPSEITAKLEAGGLSAESGSWGWLLGLRGKARCDLSAVERFMRGERSPVTRLELRVPGLKRGSRRPTGSGGRFRLGLLRHAVADRDTLEAAAGSLATRDGVRIWLDDRYSPNGPLYRYVPPRCDREDLARYTLYPVRATGDVRLEFSRRGERCLFEIRQFNRFRLEKGGRFLADEIRRIPKNSEPPASQRETGRMMDLVETDNCWRIRLVGPLTGTFVLRPVKISDRRRLLFYRV